MQLPRSFVRIGLFCSSVVLSVCFVAPAENADNSEDPSSSSSSTEAAPQGEHYSLADYAADEDASLERIFERYPYLADEPYSTEDVEGSDEDRRGVRFGSLVPSSVLGGSSRVGGPEYDGAAGPGPVQSSAGGSDFSKEYAENLKILEPQFYSDPAGPPIIGASHDESGVSGGGSSRRSWQQHRQGKQWADAQLEPQIKYEISQGKPQTVQEAQSEKRQQVDMVSSSTTETVLNEVLAPKGKRHSPQGDSFSFESDSLEDLCRDVLAGTRPEHRQGSYSSLSKRISKCSGRGAKVRYRLGDSKYPVVVQVLIDKDGRKRVGKGQRSRLEGSNVGSRQSSVFGSPYAVGDQHKLADPSTGDIPSLTSPASVPHWHRYLSRTFAMPTTRHEVEEQAFAGHVRPSGLVDKLDEIPNKANEQVRHEFYGNPKHDALNIATNLASYTPKHLWQESVNVAKQEETDAGGATIFAGLEERTTNVYTRPVPTPLVEGEQMVKVGTVIFNVIGKKKDAAWIRQRIQKMLEENRSGNNAQASVPQGNHARDSSHMVRGTMAGEDPSVPTLIGKIETLLHQALRARDQPSDASVPAFYVQSRVETLHPEYEVASLDTQQSSTESQSMGSARISINSNTYGDQRTGQGGAAGESRYRVIPWQGSYPTSRQHSPTSADPQSKMNHMLMLKAALQGSQRRGKVDQGPNKWLFGAPATWGGQTAPPTATTSPTGLFVRMTGVDRRTDQEQAVIANSTAASALPPADGTLIQRFQAKPNLRPVEAFDKSENAAEAESISALEKILRKAADLNLEQSQKVGIGLLDNEKHQAPLTSWRNSKRGDASATESSVRLAREGSFNTGVAPQLEPKQKPRQLLFFRQ